MNTNMVMGPSDIDFYLYTMKSAIFHWYPDAEIEKAYTCRTAGIDHSFLKGTLEREIANVGTFRHTQEDINFLAKVPYFKPAYIRFLTNQTWNPKDVTITYLNNGNLDIRIRGPWIYVMDWEIFLLEIISETWTRYQMFLRNISEGQIIESGLKRLDAKLDLLKEKAPKLKFTEMGTRRRALAMWQPIALDFIMKKHPDCLVGTSNVLLARKQGLKAFGTQAHEWDQGHLAFTNPLNAKKLAMIRWMEAFDGDCGIALTDTFTTKHFLTVFSKMLANAYTGVREDSGDWEIWTKQILNHYGDLKINPKTKDLVYSDTLNFPKAITIYDKVIDYAKPGFGIGTDVMNDMTDLWKPLSIVIKMTKCNGIDVLKISDCPEKTMCENPVLKEYMFQVFGVK